METAIQASKDAIFDIFIIPIADFHKKKQDRVFLLKLQIR
jgi:hypothetical protein